MIYNLISALAIVTETVKHYLVLGKSVPCHIRYAFFKLVGEFVGEVDYLSAYGAENTVYGAYGAVSACVTVTRFGISTGYAFNENALGFKSVYSTVNGGDTHIAAAFLKHFSYFGNGKLFVSVSLKEASERLLLFCKSFRHNGAFLLPQVADNVFFLLFINYIMLTIKVTV